MAAYLVKKNSFIGGRFYAKGSSIEIADAEQVRSDNANLEPLGKVAEAIGKQPAPISAAAADDALLDDDAGAEATTAGNADDVLVEGSLSSIIPTLGSKSDAEIDALEAAEKDREAPRSGLLSAIDKERKARADV